ncbi:hypothetical protein SPONL_1312 [uncultured Candidatus Thioglobus sp.]|nr:hypothetical protein SPONL_1312 [uncultured Candidatus Thioglobus sp.]
MKNIIVIILVLAVGAAIWFGFMGSKEETAVEGVTSSKTAAECEIPAYAKVIGHEDKWLLHNNCPPRTK